ncbi:Protein-L-isoaspartate O-methyltransferase 1 [Turnera subulata]|uniref:protein-L-isoaspartate(D-aspartate) O-methyltransferase n=1 Tax=Turnera subulata TaxID=218843 RepID=A0A9Q0EZP0_9ROSI|nr:Protein-L-isoaspartate O-methyltransferase 1 [Turnera subulata]
MLMPLPRSPFAYGCRNSTPCLKHFITSTHHRHHHHRLLGSATATATATATKITAQYLSTLFPFHSPRNLNCSFTGNSLFLRMEGCLCQFRWIFYFLLAIVYGASCCYTDDTQFCTNMRSWDPQSQPLSTCNGEIMHEKASSLNVPLPYFAVERLWAGANISKNTQMVENLRHYGVIRSKKVAEVMETIDRALFVPDGTPAYVDSPMAIGYNATISAPHMHAMCLQLLEENLKPGMHALDVGSGTGYLTACFALMVGPQGRTVGIEHIPELASSSITNIEKSAAAPLLKEGSLSVHVGDGRQGWPEFAPYDAIHVGAAASEIPQALIDQLKPGGRMVIPVGNIFQDLQVVDKKQDGSISIHSETSVRYVPLTSRDAQLRGD